MIVKSISAGTFKLDGGAMHGVVPKSFWNKHNPADANNLCTWQMRCLLIQEGNKLILIDTGMGNKQPIKWQNYFEPRGHDLLKENIKKAGYSHNEITDVILTHLHFDHCGGAVEMTNSKLRPTFVNAKYWTHSGHLHSAQNPNAREKATFLPENINPLIEAEQLYFVDKQTKPFENIEFLIANGHTEKMMMPLISDNSKKILFAADTVPSTYHVHIPYVMSYDVRPLDTMVEKETILARAYQENWLLAYDHDLNYDSSFITITEKGYKAVEMGNL